MAEVTDDQIRLRAHQLWEKAGRPRDGEQGFWLEAERELKNQDPAVNLEEGSTTFTE
jgi:hypothetical protein